jgi:hypothetical protein
VLAAAFALSFALWSCGYHVAGSAKRLPGGAKSIGIPTFRNDTRAYKVEQQLTAAVLKEFSVRTQTPVSSDAAGVDVVLMGEVRDVSSSPITFGTDAFGSAFQITLQVAVRLVRAKDGTLLWENPNFTFRGRYVLNSKVSEFFSESNPAVDLMAREFAASLASTLLTR